MIARRINIRRTSAAYTLRGDGGGGERPVCAVEGCEAEGKAHVCPADGANHHHGRIHYSYCNTKLIFRADGWYLICDEHYAICVSSRGPLSW